jgi:tRNA modification GTPase
VESIGIRIKHSKNRTVTGGIISDSLKFKVQSSEYIVEIEKIKNQFPLKPLVVVINKLDLLTDQEITSIRQNLKP